MTTQKMDTAQQEGTAGGREIERERERETEIERESAHGMARRSARSDSREGGYALDTRVAHLHVPCF